MLPKVLAGGSSLLPDRTKSRSKTARKDPLSTLKNTYGFTDNDISNLKAVFPTNSFINYSAIVDTIFRLKLAGYSLTEIKNGFEVLGEKSLDVSFWRTLKPLSIRLGSLENALLAYQAGMTLNDIQMMSDEELSEENLKIMVTLKTL
jgi:hypothetical protein